MSSGSRVRAEVAAKLGGKWIVIIVARNDGICSAVVDGAISHGGTGIDGKANSFLATLRPRSSAHRKWAYYPLKTDGAARYLQ